MTLIKRNDSLLDRFFNDDWFAADAVKEFSPTADIVEKKDGYELRVNLPGLDKKDINIEIKNDILTISGERINESKEEKEGYYHYESNYGSFSRSWHVDGLNTENINADYSNGVLKINLPKKEEVKARKIELK